MNKKAIAATALSRFDEKEHCYIVESPICDRVTGAAETEAEARKLFDELLDETYLAYLEGKLVGYERRGRPRKGNVEFHAQIKAEVKEQIVERARELGISQGEVITYYAAVEKSKIDLERRHMALLEKMSASQ